MNLIFSGRNRVTQAYNPGVHNGLDIVGDDSREVRCPVDGIVRSSTIITNKNDLTWEWGNYVRVDDSQGRRLFFCHLASRAVRFGQQVKAGDRLGIMGNTGRSFGAHTHFEVRRPDGKTKLDPAAYLGIPNQCGTYTSYLDSSAPAVGWTYTVRTGDSLWAIAARMLGSGSRYVEIKRLNGLKSELIRPGQVLRLPKR